MLRPTARMEARTPAAPLIAQNQGVGRSSMRETSRMPKGKPNPKRIPAGVMTAIVQAALTANGDPSKAEITRGSQNGSQITYAAVTAAHVSKRALRRGSYLPERKLPRPVARIRVKRTTLSE